jgi:hypothetical protein
MWATQPKPAGIAQHKNRAKMRNMPKYAAHLPIKLTQRFAVSAVLAVVGASVIIAQSLTSAGFAKPCLANCSSRQIQFTPGQRIQISVINRTSSLLQVEQIYGTPPLPLPPDQEVAVDPNFGTRPNASIVFWGEALPLRVELFRPAPNQLRIEILAGSQPPGDRSVYIEDDGKVKIF